MAMKLQSNTLVVVATGARAQTYLVEDGRLQAQAEWLPSGLDEEGPSGKMPPEMSEHDTDEATFSKHIAQRLYAMAHKDEFDHLVLIADPGTLGEVRPQLHLEVTDKMVLEIDKTLINSSVDDIERTITKAMHT
jgi:protein required for attachment to host cells